VAAHDIVPVPGARLDEALESAGPDLLGEMIKGSRSGNAAAKLANALSATSRSRQLC
jgi:hypothetical protein